MNGWLVVNNFLAGEKFLEIYDFLVSSAKKYGVCIKIIKTGELNILLGEKISLPDFVLFWDKDVLMAKCLEDMGARVFNSSTAIDMCDNKALTYIALSKSNIKIPKTILSPKTFDNIGYNNLDFLKNASDLLGFPYIIKEAYGSFGQQVYMINSISEAEKLVTGFGARPFVMQEFIKSSVGRDVRVNVVGGKVICSMLRYSENGDFRSNISNGGKMANYEADENQKAIAISAAEALKLDFAGVDVLFGEDGKPIICEVNSNPHFKSTLECTGINMADSIIECILDRIG